MFLLPDQAGLHQNFKMSVKFNPYIVIITLLTSLFDFPRQLAENVEIVTLDCKYTLL